MQGSRQNVDNVFILDGIETAEKFIDNHIFTARFFFDILITQS